MNAEIHTICAQLLSALLNGAYQGILVVGLVSVALRVVRTNAATRYAVWFASLLLVVLVIPAHYWLDRARPAGRAARNDGISAGLNTAKSQVFAPDSRDRFNGPSGRNEPAEQAGEEPLSRPGPDAASPVWLTIPSEIKPGKLPRLEDVRSAPAGQVAVAKRLSQRLAELSPAAAARFLQPVSLTIEPARGLPLLPALLCGLLAVALFRLSVLVFRLRQLRILVRGSSLPSADLQTLFEELRIPARSNRRVALRVSCRQQCPILLGFVRPTILLPADIANQPDPGEAREVLRHELAHVRRYDDWTNLVQHLVRAIFFFHPVVWWIGERLSLEREIACDDYVLHQGGERRNYALILTSLASRLRPGTPMLAPGVSNNNSQLQQRISMILNTRRNSSPGLAKGPLATILTATGLVVTLGLCSGPRLVLAGPPPAAATGVAPSAEPDLVPASPAVPASGPVPAPPAIDSPVVASRAPSLVALGVDPGPKFKPEIPGPAPDEVSVPEAPEPPEPPTTPSMEYAPRIMKLPKVARMEKAGKTPKVSDSSDSDKNADGSIEDRLRRLEKMVRELMEQQEQKHSPGTIYFKDRGGDQAMAERQAARAAEQAQRAAEQAQRAAEQAKRIRELDAMREQDQQYKADLRESFDRHAVHLEALRKAREALGQELERLNRQIEKIEKEQQRSESELPRPRGDAGGSKLPASPAPTERARP